MNDDVMESAVDVTPFQRGLIAAYADREEAEALVASLATHHIDAVVTSSAPEGVAYGVVVDVQVSGAIVSPYAGEAFGDFVARTGFDAAEILGDVPAGDCTWDPWLNADTMALGRGGWVAHGASYAAPRE